MQEPLYVGKITLVSIWFRMVLTLIITWIYKDSLTLTYHQISIFDRYYKFLNPWVGSLILLVMLIIDTMHSTMYWSNSGIDPF